MPELDDHELLAEFARYESEAAFAALVARYVNLVYSTALRFTGNPHHAEEITQAVFIILARKAGKLSPRTVLSGWLYQTARLTAANFVKGEIRRQRREQEAYMQSTLTEPDAAAWQQLAPQLDEAMGRLGETDRNAIVLRFFENKTAQEVGAALKLTEAAAHKRVNRALEKLRKFFSKRGVDSTAATIAETISANSVQAAPVALAKAVTAVAIAKGAAASASTLTLVKGALKIMAWTKAKTAGVVGVVMLLAAGTATIIIYHQRQPIPKPQPVAFSQTDFPKASWRFVGYADPESAFESTFWAMNQGDVKAYLASLAPDGGLFNEAQGKSESEIVTQNRQIVQGLTGYKIIDKKTVSDGRVILTFQPEMGTDQNPVPPGRMVIRRIGNEWKVSG